MTETKYIALDIYGTVLMIDDTENITKPRKGLGDFFQRCSSKGIRVIASSDSDINNVKIDLTESGVSLENFFDFIQFTETPKDFKRILNKYGIKPIELLVIGDSYDKDIKGAEGIGVGYCQVPEYRDLADNFNFNQIPIP